MTKKFSAAVALAAVIAVPVMSQEQQTPQQQIQQLQIQLQAAQQQQVQLPLDTETYTYAIIQQNGKSILHGVKRRVTAQELQQLLPNQTDDQRANAVPVPVGGYPGRGPVESYSDPVITQDMVNRCAFAARQAGYDLGQVMGYAYAFTCYGIKGYQPVPVVPVIPVYPVRPWRRW